MGRHVNDSGIDDAGSDAGSEAGSEAAEQHEHARHIAEAGHPLEPQAVISPDTHVGVDLAAAVTGAQDAEASPANPDALVEHGLVGDGHELE
jgi:hypothetical protein